MTKGERGMAFVEESQSAEPIDTRQGWRDTPPRLESVKPMITLGNPEGVLGVTLRVRCGMPYGVAGGPDRARYEATKELATGVLALLLPQAERRGLTTVALVADLATARDLQGVRDSLVGVVVRGVVSGRYTPIGLGVLVPIIGWINGLVESEPASLRVTAKRTDPHGGMVLVADRGDGRPVEKHLPRTGQAEVAACLQWIAEREKKAMAIEPENTGMAAVRCDWRSGK